MLTVEGQELSVDTAVRTFHTGTVVTPVAVGHRACNCAGRMLFLLAAARLSTLHEISHASSLLRGHLCSEDTCLLRSAHAS